MILTHDTIVLLDSGRILPIPAGTEVRLLKARGQIKGRWRRHECFVSIWDSVHAWVPRESLADATRQKGENNASR